MTEADNQRPATIAFYLPQFHAIPENDKWWGTGFTEWTNVKRAEPMYEEHEQPAHPVGPFGSYNLLETGVAAWQTNLAAKHSIDAFCFYHYWFDGHRLLEKPLDRYLQSDLTFPFLLCWANENWSRRWDGKDREILLAQRYGDDTPYQVFESFLPYLSDSRHLRLADKLPILVHRADQLPDAAEYARVWRERARQAGLGELWLIASETSYGLDPRRIGFDAVVEFPPVGDSNLSTVLTKPPTGLSKAFRGRLLSYDRLAEFYMRRTPPPFPRHPAVVPRWDNTPRRLTRSTIFVGASPARYAQWLARARATEQAQRPAGGAVFINAWNEWAEGAYLEPDEIYGDSYLRATEYTYAELPHSHSSCAGGRWSYAYVHSLALAAASSLKNAYVSRTARFRGHSHGDGK
jgi:lipopolysaccharide biosynthesis protein